jgi:hypothetical protein
MVEIPLVEQFLLPETFGLEVVLNHSADGKLFLAEGKERVILVFIDVVKFSLEFLWAHLDALLQEFLMKVADL